MLETIREYASEKLEESGEEGELRQRHAEWFVELVEEFDDRLRGPELESWLSRLDAEQGNLRAALGQLVEAAETDELLEFLNRTANYWRIRGVLVEAREWFEHGLGASAGQRTSRRARLLRSAATVYSTLGEHDTARALDEESLAISRETGDQRDVVSALISLGMDLLESRQFSQARSVYEEALASARAADDDLAVSGALWQPELSGAGGWRLPPCDRFRHGSGRRCSEGRQPRIRKLSSRNARQRLSPCRALRARHSPAGRPWKRVGASATSRRCRTT